MNNRLTYYHHALEQAQQAGDRGAEAEALSNLGDEYLTLQESLRALPCYREAWVIFQELGDRNGTAKIMGQLGNAYKAQGRYDQATEWYRRSIDEFRAIGDQMGEAISHFNLGATLAQIEHPIEAWEAYRQARLLYQLLGLGERVQACDLAIYTVTQGHPEETGRPQAPVIDAPQPRRRGRRGLGAIMQWLLHQWHRFWHWVGQGRRGT